MRAWLRCCRLLAAWGAALGAALGFAFSAWAASAPVVHATISSKPPYLVGQQLTLQVEVLVPNFFMSAPKWPLLTIPGAVATLSEGASEHSNATIAGQDYAGIRQTYLIVAQQEGEFTLPPVKIPFDYAAVPGQKSAGAVTLPALKFSVKLPPGAAAAAASGAAGASAGMPVARVTLTQTLDRDAVALKTLKVGDTLTRTVVAYAANTQSMMIPPPRFDAPRGVRVYPADPVLRDERQDRVGFVGGRRTDRVTYLFEKPGEVKLPAVEVGWFNAASNRREVARAPGIVLTVAPKPDGAPAIAPAAAAASGPAARPAAGATGFNWRRWLPWGLGAIALLVGVWRAWPHYLPRWRALLEARRQRRAASEESAFATLEKACRRGDATATYVAFGVWCRRCGATSVDELNAAVPEAGLQAQMATLERHLYGADAGGAWDPATLRQAVRSVRAAWRERLRRPPAAMAMLAPLNPAVTE